MSFIYKISYNCKSILKEISVFLIEKISFKIAFRHYFIHCYMKVNFLPTISPRGKSKKRKKVSIYMVYTFFPLIFLRIIITRKKSHRLIILIFIKKKITKLKKSDRRHTVILQHYSLFLILKHPVHCTTNRSINIHILFTEKSVKFTIPIHFFHP